MAIQTLSSWKVRSLKLSMIPWSPSGHFQTLPNHCEEFTWPHGGLVTHVCVNGLGYHWLSYCLVNTLAKKPIIWTNVVLLLIGLLGTNFCEILIKIQKSSLKKVELKNIICTMAAIFSWPQCANSWIQHTGVANMKLWYLLCGGLTGVIEQTAD